MLRTGSALIVLFTLIWPPAQALWREQEQRLNVGLKLFPACLAADMTLASRVTAAGELLILVGHDDDIRAAAQAASRLLQLERIQNLPLRVEIIALRDLTQYDGSPVAGLFLATPDTSTELLAYAAQQLRTLSFSPYAGEVERGSVAGIHVADRILPFVNLAQARQADVRFKPFFLQVARQHE